MMMVMPPSSPLPIYPCTALHISTLALRVYKINRIKHTFSNKEREQQKRKKKKQNSKLFARKLRRKFLTRMSNKAHTVVKNNEKNHWYISIVTVQISLQSIGRSVRSVCVYVEFFVNFSVLHTQNDVSQREFLWLFMIWLWLELWLVNSLMMV